MSSVPRVAMITTSLGTGGATIFLCNLGGEFVRRGIPVQVISFDNDNSFATDFQRLGVPTICHDDKKQILEDRTKSILEHLSDFKPSVVIANLGTISFEILRYLPPGVFRLGVVHADDPGVYRSLRPYSQCLDAIAAVSKRIAETLETMPEFAKVSVKYLPLGVPMPATDRRTQLADTHALKILYLGRLGQVQKRGRLFPQILEALKSAGVPFHWSIVGEGIDSAFLENSMRTSSPQQTVSFHGKVDYSQVSEVLSKHDVYLLTSDFEGLPLTLLEAMGHGLVPVVSDLPSGIREVVDNNTGIRVAMNDVPGYAKAIIWLHQNRDSLRTLSENARKRVLLEFSTEAMANRWLAAFPENAPNPVIWPTRWQVKPPLTAESLFRFSPAGRMLRRLKFAGRNLITK